MLRFLFNIKNKDACDFHTGILVYIFIMKVFSIQKLR